MSKLFVDFKKELDLTKYNCDGFIIHSYEFSCHNDDSFILDESLEISKKIKNISKLSILNINRIIMEDDLDELIVFLDKVYDKFDLFLYSDMAIRFYFESKGLEEKLIYDSKTLVASSQEVSSFNEEKIKVVLANELSFDEIKEIVSSNNENVGLEVFGYHQMFYSKRNLVNLYKEFFKLEEKLDNQKLYIKEELRENLFLIYESHNGTFIYTDYIYCMFEELFEIKEKIDFIIINGIFIPESEYVKIVNIYNSLLLAEKSENIKKLKEELQDVCKNISKGFLLNKSVLLKENESEK